MKNKKLFWLYVLSASIYGIQGIEGLPGDSIFAYMKETLNLSPEKVMFLSGLITIPWIIKPIEGFFIDNYFTKKLWVILSLIGSISISLVFGLSPLMTSISTIIMLSILGNFNTAFRDISNDGLACVEGKENDTCDKFQNIQWTSLTIAGIFTLLCGGYIADHFNYKIGYLALIPIYLLMFIPLFFYKEKKEKINSSPILEKIKSYKELFTNKPFLMGCLFIFLFNFNPSFGTKLRYIMRDDFGWSWTFMGILGAISKVMAIVGSVIYYKFSKRINIKKCLIWAVYIGAIITLAYLWFTPITAIIYDILFSVVSMFIFLNVMTFMAKSTIEGKESTSFALLCSISNLAAGTISLWVGSKLLVLFGLKSLIIISSLTSFLCLPIIKKLEINEKEN